MSHETKVVEVIVFLFFGIFWVQAFGSKMSFVWLSVKCCANTNTVRESQYTGKNLKNRSSGETSHSVWIGEFRENNWVLAFHWQWKPRGSNFVGTFDWNWKIEKFLGSNFVWAFDWNILHQRLSTELRFKGKLPEKCRFCRRNISYFFLRVTGYFAI